MHECIDQIALTRPTRHALWWCLTLRALELAADMEIEFVTVRIYSCMCDDHFSNADSYAMHVLSG